MKQTNLNKILAVSAGLAGILGTYAVSSAPGLRMQQEEGAELNESHFYGYVGAGTYNVKNGVYEVFQDGGYEYMWTEPLLDQRFYMLNGWIRDGVLCGFAQFGFGSLVFGYAYEEIDVKTGQNKIDPYQISLDDNYLPYYQIATYNPDNDRIYGYGFVDSYGDKTVFKSSPGSEPGNASIVKEDVAPEEVCLAMCWNDDEGVLAGINLDHKFVYIDNDGTQREVLDLGIEDLQNLVSAMVWSPEDGYYIFNAISVNEGNKVSELYAINPDTESVELLSPVTDAVSYIYMVNIGNGVSPEAPAVPVFNTVDFGAGDTSGHVTFTLPETRGNGDSLSGKLTYMVWLDGELMEETQGECGETVTARFNDLTDGDHVFRVQTSFDGLKSPKATTRAFIGKDTPLAPTNVNMTFDTVSWDAVTEGMHKGYIDLDAMEYEVYLNGEYIDSTSDTSMSIELPEGELTAYTCTVYAVCDGKESAGAESNAIVFGDPLTLDVEIAPTEEEAYLVTVLDANNDLSTWHPRNYQGGIVFSYYNDAVNEGDDWLFLPGIEFDDSSAYYSFSMEQCCNSPYRAEEYFEVWISSTPDLAGERHCILDKTQGSASGFQETYVGFSIPEADVWYVGIRAVSMPGQQYLNIRNIRIDNTGATIDGPEAVSDMSFIDKSTEETYLSEVTFKMPETQLDGEAIAAGTMITATLTGVSEATVNGLPGSIQSAEVEVAEGFSTVNIQTSADGKNGGKTFIKVYAGPDAPGRVSEFIGTVSEDNMSVNLSWTAPTDGIHGGSIDQGSLTYRVMLYNGRVFTYQPEIDTTEYEFTAPEENQDLKNYTFSICAINDKGMTDENQPIVTVQLGTPLALPLADEFENGEIGNQPLEGTMLGMYADTQWGLADPAILGEEYALDGEIVMAGTANADDTTGCLIFPKFSTLTDMPYTEIEMYVWTGENAAEMTLTATASGLDETAELGKIEGGNGWQTVKFILPEDMQGRQWVELRLVADYADADKVALLAAYFIHPTNETTVESIDTNAASIKAGRGVLTINAQKGAKVNIWNVDGTLCASQTTDAESTTLDIASGIYIVSVDGVMFKTRIK